jgi:RNA polymerase sigma-70 factor (ECF subfamily)
MKEPNLQKKYLLFKAKNKDPKAFSKVYDLYVERIYRFVYFKVSSQEQAQDLTSDVFLKTWQAIIDGKDIRNLNAFIYKVARNLVIDYYRQERKREVALEQDEVEQQQITVVLDQLKEVETKLEVEKIEAKLKELKEEYREVIILRFIEGLSIKEIAEIVDKKTGTVRVILYRAINTLKDLMSEDEDQAS